MNAVPAIMVALAIGTVPFTEWRLIHRGETQAEPHMDACGQEVTLMVVTLTVDAASPSDTLRLTPANEVYPGFPPVAEATLTSPGTIVYKAFENCARYTVDATSILAIVAYHVDAHEWTRP